MQCPATALRGAAMRDSDEAPGELYEAYVDHLLAGGRSTPERFARERGIVLDAALERLLDPLFRESDARRPNGSGLDSGTRLGDFLLLERLGEGGMGIVYRAREERLERDVALKIIRPEYARSRTAIARFEREARAIARLKHPNIVTVHSVGELGPVHFIAMEYVPGRGLDELLAEARASGERPPLRSVLRWLADIARALHCAHAQGVVHRDVKPSNIRITPEGEARLLDFGLARELDAAAVTFTQSFVGSPYYAAPEQLALGDDAVSPLTDVYAVGAVLYECVTGSPPHAGRSMEQVLHSIATRDPPPPRALNPQVSRDLSVVVQKAMDKDPARRYGSAAALADDLEALLEYRSIAARPAGFLLRAWRWVRRRPALAAAWGTAAAAALIAISVPAALGLAATAAERREARAALEEARALLAEFQAKIEEVRAIEDVYAPLDAVRFHRYFTAEEDRRLAELEQDVHRLRDEREATYALAREKLQRAERRGAERAAVRAVLAELYFVSWEDAVRRHDSARIALFRSLLEEVDDNRRWIERLEPAVVVPFVSDPPGAEVHLFVRREQSAIVAGGERRLVPVPLRGADGCPVPPGTWCLRLARDHEALRSGDLILRIAGHGVEGTLLSLSGSGAIPASSRLVALDDEPVRDRVEVGQALLRGDPGARHRFRFETGSGASLLVEASSLEELGIELLTPREAGERGGVAASVWSDGRVHEMTLPAGLDLRITSQPLFFGAASFAGKTPLAPMALEDRNLVVVYRLRGHREFRVATNRDDPMLGREAWLCPEDLAPLGFAPLPARGRWIAEYEVTAGEYLEFLNDPETRAEIERTGATTLVPRGREELLFARAADGSYRIGDHTDPDWPVLGVSWHDAKAYAGWVEARARARGLDHRYDLPSQLDWAEAAAATQFVFGDRFYPKWVSSCFARPKPTPEPVGSYGIDESALGVFDLSGSASEWTDAWWREDLGLRRYHGGSWGDGGPADKFTVWVAGGRLPERPANTIGFRLLLVTKE